MYPIVITQSTSPNFQKKIFTFLIIFLKKWSIQESARAARFDQNREPERFFREGAKINGASIIIEAC